MIQYLIDILSEHLKTCEEFLKYIKDPNFYADPEQISYKQKIAYSIKNVIEYLNNKKCAKCNGTGYVKGKIFKKKCDRCNGNGIMNGNGRIIKI